MQILTIAIGNAIGAVISKIMASDRLTDAEKLKVIDVLNN